APAQVPVELRHREGSAPAARRVDQALVDQPRARGSELLGAPAEHRRDLAGRLLLAAQLRHRTKVTKFQVGCSLGPDAEERVVQLELDHPLRLEGNALTDRLTLRG